VTLQESLLDVMRECVSACVRARVSAFSVVSTHLKLAVAEQRMQLVFKATLLLFVAIRVQSA
jgi:endonuclease/exonuclease/phosphatase family metal-dependent hydrolase